MFRINFCNRALISDISRDDCRNVLETIRYLTKRSKGCLTREGMLHMMFKQGQCDQKKWGRIRGFNTLGKVIIGVKFKDGIEQTQTNQVAA